jgi:endonuclease I
MQLPWRKRDDPMTIQLKKVLVDLITLHAPHTCQESKARELKWNQVALVFSLDHRASMYNQVRSVLLSMQSPL